MIRPKFQCDKKLYCFLALLTLLFVTRAIDFSILNDLVNREHNHLMNNKYYQENREDIYYYPMGFSSYNGAIKRVNAISKSDKGKVFVLSYFDFLSPSRYLILNKGEQDLISLPWLGPGDKIEVVKGITEVNFYKFDYMTVKNKNKKKGTVMPIIGSFFSTFIDDTNAEKKSPAKNEDGTFSLNFELKTTYFDFSHYITKIHLFYFYFPLIIILIFLQKYKIHLSFYYFIIMPFLTTGGHFMIYGPSLGLVGIPHQFPGMIIITISLLLMVLYGIFFIKQIRIGMAQWKKGNLSLREKMIILYFLLLPIFLRF